MRFFLCVHTDTHSVYQRAVLFRRDKKKKKKSPKLFTRPKVKTCLNFQTTGGIYKKKGRREVERKEAQRGLNENEKKNEMK